MKVGMWQKNMRLIATALAEAQVTAPLFATTVPVYNAAMGVGHNEHDTAAVFDVLSRMTGLSRANQKAQHPTPQGWRSVCSEPMAQRNTLQYRHKPRGVSGGLILSQTGELDLQTYIGRGSQAQITDTLQSNNCFVVKVIQARFAFLRCRGSTKTPS